LETPAACEPSASRDNGRSIDFEKIVDKQLNDLTVSRHGSSFVPDRKSMLEFAKVRREYQPGQTSVYNFPVPRNCVPSTEKLKPYVDYCEVKDGEIQELFEPALDSFLESLEIHYRQVCKRKKGIDKIIFSGEMGISPYVEDSVKDWGIGAGILSTNIQLFPIMLGRYIRHEST
jgi:hypothetical protein